MYTLHPHHQVVVFFVCASMLCACVDIQPLGNSNSVVLDEQLIGSEGGELTIRGARLFVPPNAFNQPTKVQLTKTELPAALPDFVRSVSPAYTVNPQEAVHADVPFSLSLEFQDGDGVQGNEILLMTVEGCGIWILSEAIVKNRVTQGTTLTADLIKLGIFTVVEIDEGAFNIYKNDRAEANLSPPCLMDENCQEEVCETGEGEVECAFTRDSGYCGVDGVCIPVMACACFQNRECNADSFGCRIPANFPVECMAGLDTLVANDQPFALEDNPMFLNEGDEDDE